MAFDPVTDLASLEATNLAGTSFSTFNPADAREFWGHVEDATQQTLQQYAFQPPQTDTGKPIVSDAPTTPTNPDPKTQPGNSDYETLKRIARSGSIIGGGATLSEWATDYAARRGISDQRIGPDLDLHVYSVDKTGPNGERAALIKTNPDHTQEILPVRAEVDDSVWRRHLQPMQEYVKFDPAELQKYYDTSKMSPQERQAWAIPEPAAATIPQTQVQPQLATIDPPAQTDVQLKIGAVTNTVATTDVQEDRTCHPNGFWAPDPSYAAGTPAAQYQDQINGGHIGQNYYVPTGLAAPDANGRRATIVQSYDGCITPQSAATGAPIVSTPTLVDAKQGYGSFFQTAEDKGFLDLSKYTNEARSQVLNAGGTPVRWYASDSSAVPYFTRALVGTGAAVQHEPMR